MMYFMSTETLTEEYTKDHSLKEILETKFVLVSSRIKYPHCDNVIPSKLYDEKLIFAMYGDKDDYKIIVKLIGITLRGKITNSIRNFENSNKGN